MCVNVPSYQISIGFCDGCNASLLHQEVVSGLNFQIYYWPRKKENRHLLYCFPVMTFLCDWLVSFLACQMPSTAMPPTHRMNNGSKRSLMCMYQQQLNGRQYMMVAGTAEKAISNRRFLKFARFFLRGYIAATKVNQSGVLSSSKVMKGVTSCVARPD